MLLVATGRAPNGDTLDLARGGIEVDDDGLIVVDDYQRTSAEGVFALGDVCSQQQLKHVANKDARVVQHNLLHPDSMITSDRRFVPRAVFSMPQVASVGLSEAEAEEQGIDYVVSRQDYGETAFGWAMEDTDHFVKIVADAKVEDHPRGPPDRSAGVIADSAADPGDELRATRARRSARPVLDPPCDDRSDRERPAWPQRLGAKYLASLSLRPQHRASSVRTWVNPLCLRFTHAATCVRRTQTGLTQFPTEPWLMSYGDGKRAILAGFSGARSAA